MKIRLVQLLLLLFSTALVHGQNYGPFVQVKKYTSQQPPNKFDSSLGLLTNRLGAAFHYLYPLYQALTWEQKFRAKTGDAAFYESFAEALAFAGDYAMASRYSQKKYMALPDSIQDSIRKKVEELQHIQYVPARKTILDIARHYNTIMINEAHSKPEHRAFTYSLLDDLYKAGYRYLAMEALNNYANKCLDSLNSFTGYYTGEPVAGELVRHAIKLGYTLIAYEDTAGHTNLSLRDSIQAANIYNRLRGDAGARVLIHAGYGHTSKEPIGDFIPMAVWYTKISGQIPFCIDQTEMTEGSYHEYGRLVYQYFTKRYQINEPSILFQQNRSFNPSGLRGYDAIVCHPPVKNIQNRPAWLTLNNERQPVLIAPSERTLFLVQAYYKEEYSTDMVNYTVPADQTYVAAPSGYYCLFLKKGDYKIVLRDASYKILSEKELTVK